MKFLRFFIFLAFTANTALATTDTLQQVQPQLLMKPIKVDYAYGIDELKKAGDLYKAVEEAASYQALADAYAELHQNKAIENYVQALNKLKNFKISKPYADLSYKISSLYYKQKKYDASAKYLIKAIAGYEGTGLTTVAGTCYIRMATIKFEQKNYKDAEALIMKKGYPLCGPADNMSCYELLARTYQEQNRFSEAKWYYLQANTLSRKLQDTTSIITSLTSLGKVKIAIKEYALALKDLDEAENLAQGEAYEMLLPQIKSAQQVIQARAPKLFEARIALNDPTANAKSAAITGPVLAVKLASEK